VTSFEERRELMHMAEAVREELRSVTKRVHLLINKIIGEGDALMLAAADERSAGMETTVKAVKYNGIGKVTEAVEQTLGVKLPAMKGTTVTGRISSAQANISAPPPAPAGKRACSACHSLEPYPHRAKNCPNAHLLQQQKKAEVAARPIKKLREPMSAERRAKAVESLKKARAARKPK
jgi:hypothetical protein